MAPRRLTRIVLLAAAAACAPDPAPSEHPAGREPAAGDGQTPPAVEEIACQDLARTILAVEPLRASLAREFGAPDSIVATVEPNRHVPGRMDSLFVVHYSGLTSFLRKPGGGQDMMDHVVVTENRFLSHPSIGVGVSGDRVIAALGEPTRRTAESLVYDCGMHVEEPVTFHLEDHVVRRIEIDYYLD